MSLCVSRNSFYKMGDKSFFGQFGSMHFSVSRSTIAKSWKQFFEWLFRCLCKIVFYAEPRNLITFSRKSQLCHKQNWMNTRCNISRFERDTQGFYHEENFLVFRPALDDVPVPPVARPKREISKNVAQVIRFIHAHIRTAKNPRGRSSDK